MPKKAIRGGNTAVVPDYGRTSQGITSPGALGGVVQGKFTGNSRFAGPGAGPSGARPAWPNTKTVLKGGKLGNGGRGKMY